MFFEDYKCLNNLSVINRNLLDNTFSSVDSVDLIVDDTFFYDRSTFTLKGKSTSLKRGSICIKFDNVRSGDIIECECEIRKISGDNPYVSITECDSTHERDFNELCKKHYNLDGEFQLIKLTTNMINDKSVNVIFGLGLDEVGEYEVRNMKARILRNVDNAIKKVTKSYAIYKMPTGWQIRTDVWDSDIDGSLTVKDTNTLKLNFDRFKLAPIPSIGENFDNNGIKYDVRVGQVKHDSIEIKVVDRTTNTLVDLSTLSNYFQFYVTLNGYSYV